MEGTALLLCPLPRQDLTAAPLCQSPAPRARPPTGHGPFPAPLAAGGLLPSRRCPPPGPPASARRAAPCPPMHRHYLPLRVGTRRQDSLGRTRRAAGTGPGLRANPEIGQTRRARPAAASPGYAATTASPQPAPLPLPGGPRGGGRRRLSGGTCPWIWLCRRM